MDVKVSTSEFTREADSIATAVEALLDVGNRYVACLQGVKAYGYSSDASGTSIDARCSEISRILAQFEKAGDAIQKTTKSFVTDIDQIDSSL